MQYASALSSVENAWLQTSLGNNIKYTSCLILYLVNPPTVVNVEPR